MTTIRRILCALVAILGAVLACTPTVGGVEVSDEPAAVTYAYDAAGLTRAPNEAVSDRGPPAIYSDYTASRSAADTASHGPLARPRSAPTWGYTVYDLIGQVVLVASVPGTTRTASDRSAADVRAVLGRRVAANAGSKLLPKVDKVFQFPGAGRSGAGVKNFVGPPNTIARGASPGRVFVTDDHGRVILDITRDRVKPMVPGQSFIAGDGRKLTPTSEQLAWIDELWGG